MMLVTGHRRNDLRSLRLHEAIVKKLHANPDAVLQKAKANLERRGNSQNGAYYVREWHRLLYGPLEELLAVMLADTEYATALRQATPFSGVLTPEENWAIYRSFREEWQNAAR